MTVGDTLLLASVGLWVIWAVIALVRRRVGRCCCTACSGNCAGCAQGKHNRNKAGGASRLPAQERMKK